MDFGLILYSSGSLAKTLFSKWTVFSVVMAAWAIYLPALTAHLPGWKFFYFQTLLTYLFLLCE